MLVGKGEPVLHELLSQLLDLAYLVLWKTMDPAPTPAKLRPQTWPSFVLRCLHSQLKSATSTLQYRLGPMLG